jgi:hypothetical protein
LQIKAFALKRESSAAVVDAPPRSVGAGIGIAASEREGFFLNEQKNFF